MELPKFILGDNTEFPNAIFVIHTEFPRFIINLETDEVDWLEDFDTQDEEELLSEPKLQLKKQQSFMIKKFLLTIINYVRSTYRA